MTAPCVATTQPGLRFVACPGASKAGPNGPGDALSHRMAYWEWAAPEVADPSHLIIALHGLSRNGRDFDVLARRFSDRARVVCPDLVGRGQSDWLADPAGYQVPAYVADALMLVQQLLQEAEARGQPIRRLDWIGTSLGGLVGMGIVTLPQLPLPVARLVLNDVGPVVEWAALQRIGQYIGRTPQFADVQAGAAYLREIAASFGPHSDAQWLALSRPMLRAHPQGGLTLHHDPDFAIPYAQMTERAAGQAQHTLWALYDRITAQTLLLRGRDSDLLSAETARLMAQRGPKAQVVEFAGVGHAPTLVHDDQIHVVEAFLFGDR